MKISRAIVLGLTIVLGAPFAVAAGDAAAGKGAYAVCAACHGPSGEGNVAMRAPRLAGQGGWYIERQLKSFQAGHRGSKPGDSDGMQMRGLAMSVSSPEAMANLIAYIETLPAKASATTVQGDAAAGKTLYMTCGACHGQNAEGSEQMGGPRLAGLDDWYIVRQLKNFKGGLRGSDPADTFGRQMAPMAAVLADDAAINNVVAYINSLQ
ncbi:MAG: c-type cytochrome [Pseudomonadales bacterium]